MIEVISWVSWFVIFGCVAVLLWMYGRADRVKVYYQPSFESEIKFYRLPRVMLWWFMLSGAIRHDSTDDSYHEVSPY